MNIDKLWATYHHIKKLDELGGDERGNKWNQNTFGNRKIPGRDELEDKWAEGEITSEQYETAMNAIKEEYLPADELCGTNQCFAGWYAFDQGVKMNGFGRIEDREGHITYVEDFVRADAELTGDQSVMLFGGGNTLEDLADELIILTGEDRR